MTDDDLKALRVYLPNSHGCNDGNQFVMVDKHGTTQETLTCPICAAHRLLAEVYRLRDVMRIIALRCGYILGMCRDGGEMKLEAEAILKLLGENPQGD